MYAFRALAHRYPKLFQLLATHRLNTPTGVRVIEELLELVRDAMPDERLAGQWFRVLSYYVTGAALDETAGYAKGPSAAEPVSDAYVEEHCPQPPRDRALFQGGLVGQHVRARNRAAAGRDARCRAPGKRAGCGCSSRAQAGHSPEALIEPEVAAFSAARRRRTSTGAAGTRSACNL